jgi:hypothetical protein
VRCDLPPGDDDRAYKRPLMMRWGNPGTKPRPKWKDVVADIQADQPGRCTMWTCGPSIDWRLRCLAAEAERDEAQGANVLNRNALKHAKAVCEEIFDYAFAGNQTVLDERQNIRQEMFREIGRLARAGIAGEWESRELNIRDAEIEAMAPVVAAAEAWRDADRPDAWDGLVAAIDTYRLARGKAGT